LFDAAIREAIEQAAGRKGTADAALGELTTLGCGGAAAFLIEAESAGSLAGILKVAAANGIDWFVLGRGSNLLVADSGWPGLVVRLAGALKECSLQQDGRLQCGGGASLPRAAAIAADAGLSGLEPLAAIPGSIGGAIAMNAGAWGTAIGDLTAAVEICLPGETRRLEASELRFSYRRLELPPDAVVSRAWLEFETGMPDHIRAVTAEFRNRREQAQPGGRSCGSVFRNPTGGKTAGELLDGAGCKGLTIGGAIISEQHANFILNQGGATAADIVALMDECRHRVFEQSRIVLEPEVRLLGDIRLELVK